MNFLFLLQTGGLVCGTDGITYKNDCELRKSACERKLPVQASYKGDCGMLLIVFYLFSDLLPTEV